MKKIAILASGSGTLAQAIFDARQNVLTDADIVAVITDKADAQVLDRALAASVESFVIPMLPDRTEWDRELETLIAALKPDLARLGAMSLEVTSNKRRKEAHAFYQSVGFLNSHEKFTIYF